jgi:hypothetical protein
MNVGKIAEWLHSGGRLLTHSVPLAESALSTPVRLVLRRKCPLFGPSGDLRPARMQWPELAECGLAAFGVRKTRADVQFGRRNVLS